MFRPIDLAMHRVVEDVTYGKDRPVPRVDHELILYSILKPPLVRKYNDCPLAMRLIKQTSWEKLIELGKALNSQRNQKDWAAQMARWSGFALSQGDPMVPMATGEAASQLASYLQELGVSEAIENNARAKALRAEVEVAGLAALGAVLKQACASAPSVEAPSLALSGGSANGAFTAGFLFELLRARELAWRRLTTPAEQASFLDSSRFSAVVGTSVGSLIGQLIDLYSIENLRGARSGVEDQFRDDKDALAHVAYEPYFPPPTLRGLTTLLLKAPSTDAELSRQWALVKLFEHFTDLAEPEAICVQPGPASRVVGYPLGAVAGLMRFDPLERQVIQPLLARVGGATTQNGFPRVAVSVEVSQNVTVGLDDTACSETGDQLKSCLASGIMAATVLPFFAQPVNRVHTGLSTQEDCGIWLDGGLRSGFPIERALPFSRPSSSGAPRLRTLAVATSRATGLPSSKTEDTLLDLAKAAIKEMGNQVQVSEVMASSRFVFLEQERWVELEKLMQSSVTPLPVEATAPGAEAAVPVSHDLGPTPEPEAVVQASSPVNLEQNPYLAVVFVPRSVPDYFIANTGYRFDPIVMRGLFVSGQKEAIRRAKMGLIDQLGWERAALVLAELEADEQALVEWLSSVDHSWAERASKRYQDGRFRFERRVESCPEAPRAGDPPPPDGTEEVPSYFGGHSPLTCRRLGASH